MGTGLLAALRTACFSNPVGILYAAQADLYMQRLTKSLNAAAGERKMRVREADYACSQKTKFVRS